MLEIASIMMDSDIARPSFHSNLNNCKRKGFPFKYSMIKKELEIKKKLWNNVIIKW